MSVTTASQRLAPPKRPGVIKWLRKNLFNNWYNSLLTVGTVVLLYLAIRAALQWAFVTADWRPVTTAPLLYLVGQYPRAELWRVGGSLWMVSFEWSTGSGSRRRKRRGRGGAEDRRVPDPAFLLLSEALRLRVLCV